MKNKTKKYRGGKKIVFSAEPSNVISDLKDILNSRPIIYNFDINYNDSYKTYYVSIENSNDFNLKEYNESEDHCLSFQIKEIKGLKIIYIETIYKCAPIKNYGIFILDSIKEYAKNFGFYSVIIGSDASSLEFHLINVNGRMKSLFINLSYLSILSTGESWYNRMGFCT